MTHDSVSKLNNWLITNVFIEQPGYTGPCNDMQFLKNFKRQNDGQPLFVLLVTCNRANREGNTKASISISTFLPQP